uniref:Uncharacterized protein n=1 Tax=Romanomermis culicivorax TaxID=13658 RepID=A0A915I0T9_ROMCU
MATSLKPRCSKRLTTSPTKPRWTPSGLTARKSFERCALRSYGLVLSTKWVGYNVSQQPKILCATELLPQVACCEVQP